MLARLCDRCAAVGAVRARTLALTALVLVPQAAALGQAPYRLTLTGASPGGLWSLLGAGINAAVAARHPGSVVTYQTSGGGLANVVLVSGGRAELGIVHDVELRAALRGAEPFRAPVGNLTAVAYLYDWAPMQLLLTQAFAERYGIETLGDLIASRAPVRFSVNTRGNIVQEINRQILAAYGVTYEDIESWGGQIVFAASNEMANLMANRRIDMSGNGLFAPHNTILQSSNAVDVTLLSLDASVIETLAANAGVRPFTVPAAAYEWLDSDVPTVALGAALVAADTMAEAQAYDLARALVEHIERLQGVHAAMRALTPAFMASHAVIPYHPGALRYYREAGLAD